MTGSTRIKEKDNAKREKPQEKQDNNQDGMPGFLGWIEKVGNKLPDPFWLFVILSGVVAVSSWLASRAGLKATDPASGEEIHVESLLTGENISRMVTDAVENFIAFPPLGVILATMLGVAVAEQTGLLAAMVRSMVDKVSPKMLTFMLALAGVTGSVASDAIYVIIIPLGAMAFHAIGRSPVVGAMVAFAASSAGFNSSLILNITDLLLAGISTSAAQLVDDAYDVSPLANIFFVIPSAIVLSLVITAVTEFYVDKKAQALVDDDHIDEDELQLDETNQPDDAHLTDDDDISLTPLERKGLAWAGVTLVVTLAAFFALLLIPASPFARPEEGFMESPLIQAIAIPITLIFFATGLVYGLVVGTINEAADIPKFMAKGLESLLPILVLFFAVSQFLAWFQWSNLGPWTAIKGSELLQSWDLPNMVLFAAFVLMVTTINLFITSGSAQWALMAPIVVPMMMYIGISPEVTQMLYRIGDSPSNIITPMSPYFALALTFLQKYYKKAGVGTLMSLSLPYAVSMLIGWFVFFIIWYFLGIPLGPGSPMGYEV
ncbi:AbgT family transporter [Corynebacterium lujinxingii]|uniref:AbgT family transporter n=1 Tax=Corynebacterium lujinxingii TaxID=2763010 RepID=A0A7H0JXE4_9CORY|nr:AbgT family transporter [Corynebacterium lujinxingii]NNO09902.1 p-aminobenzoyl-glutamate transporter [Corynebacterium lujinxingii]QNP89710.1 AbgT family transporter [Corynebacterium lujinxingii]